MARTELTPITIYCKDEAQKDILERAAALENRSLSNYLLTHGLQVAEEKGIRSFGLDKKKSGTKSGKKKTAGAR